MRTVLKDNKRISIINNLVFKSIVWIVILLTVTSFAPTAVQKVSMKMETKNLSKGMQVTINADIYYHYAEGKMIMHFINPIEYILITNNKGEAKIYNPKTNEVSLKMGFDFDTKNTLLYYFLANKQYDLGLKDLGFTLQSTSFDDGLMITKWKPPFSMNTAVGYVELVHEKYLPIYLAYYTSQNKLSKKIYYYDYAQVANVKVPVKVVEFNYFNENDSMVSKTTYSNIKYNEQAQSTYFNYKIPENAKVVE